MTCLQPASLPPHKALPITYPAPGFVVAAGSGGCKIHTRVLPLAGPQARSRQHPGCLEGRPGSATPGCAELGAAPPASVYETRGGTRCWEWCRDKWCPQNTIIHPPWYPWPVCSPTVTSDQDRMSCMSRLRLCHARRLFMFTCSWCHSVTRA